MLGINVFMIVSNGHIYQKTEQQTDPEKEGDQYCLNMGKHFLPTQHMMRYTAEVSLYEPVYLLNMKITTNFCLLSYFIINIHLRLWGFAAISCYIKTVQTLSKTSNTLRKC